MQRKIQFLFVSPVAYDFASLSQRTMLRYLLQGQGSSLAQQTPNMLKAPSGAWNGAWRRLYTTSQRRVTQNAPNGLAAPWRSVAPTFRPMNPIGLRAATPRRGFRFSAWRRNTSQGDKPESLSLSQRLKKLFKDYGKSAIGVYLALSVLDFPFCFLLVRIVGTETIGRSPLNDPTGIFLAEDFQQRNHAVN